MAIDFTTNVTHTDDNHRSVEFRVSISEMEKHFNRNIGEFRKQVSMKGFRPGQVPKQLFVSRFGEEVYKETVERIINNDLKQEFEKIIDTWKTEEKLEVAAPAEHGEVQAVRGQELIYTLNIALNKPLTVQGYKDLGVQAPAVVIEEGEADEVIKGVRQHHKLEEVSDEEFCQKMGVKDLAELKERVTEDILKEKEYKAKQSALKEAFDKLIESNQFPVLEEQIKFAAQRSMQRYSYSEEEIQITEEQLNEMRPEITRSIQEDRILRAIIEQESLKPTQAQVDAKIEEMAKAYGMDFARAKDAMRKNGQINRIREMLKVELAQNLLIGGTLPERASE